MGEHLTRATLMYGAGDDRVENVPDSVLKQPTDALICVTASSCGSCLHPYGSMSSVLSAAGAPQLQR